MASKPSPNDHFFHTLKHKRLPHEPAPHNVALEKLVRDRPDIQREMRRISWDSDPYADPEQRREMGLLVRRNAKGDIWTESYPKPGKRGPNKDGDYEIQPDNPSSIAGSFRDMADWLLGNQTIATIHTHVENPLRSDGSPSEKDYAYAGKNGRQRPGIIVGHNGQYYYGPALPPQRLPGWQFWK